MKELTEQEAYLRLASLCAQAEHCEHEMHEKMSRWGLDGEARQRVADRLKRERYVDDERYARAFVNDKIRYNRWGRRKVEQALWQKRISDDVQQRVLGSIAPDLYVEALRPLIAARRKTVKAGSDYELNQKLIRFALGRGFDYDTIRQVLTVDD